MKSAYNIFRRILYYAFIVGLIFMSIVSIHGFIRGWTPAYTPRMIHLIFLILNTYQIEYCLKTLKKLKNEKK